MLQHIEEAMKRKVEQKHLLRISYLHLSMCYNPFSLKLILLCSQCIINYIAALQRRFFWKQQKWKLWSEFFHLTCFIGWIVTTHLNISAGLNVKQIFCFSVVGSRRKPVQEENPASRESLQHLSTQRCLWVNNENHNESRTKLTFSAQTEWSWNLFWQIAGREISLNQN